MTIFLIIKMTIIDQSMFIQSLCLFFIPLFLFLFLMSFSLYFYLLFLSLYFLVFSTLNFMSLFLILMTMVQIKLIYEIFKLLMDVPFVELYLIFLPRKYQISSFVFEKSENFHFVLSNLRSLHPILNNFDFNLPVKGKF